MQVWQAAQTLGWQYRGLTVSPITGPAGNVEYLLWLSTAESEQPPLNLTKTKEIITETT
jgi:23S rRNA (cytidine1920-2'-O)/16S rRNA (cytidine1409-2'-O)-methyltransferase